MSAVAFATSHQRVEEFALAGTQSLVINALRSPALADIFYPLAGGAVPDLLKRFAVRALRSENTLLIAGERQVEGAIGGGRRANAVEVDELGSETGLR